MNRPFGPGPRIYSQLSAISIPRDAFLNFLHKIRACLMTNKHVHSYGSLFNIGMSANTSVICCVFGTRTPGLFKAPMEMIYEEISIPVLIVSDSIDNTAITPPDSWINKPVRHAFEIDLGGYSLGQEGDVEEAGSFGFYGDVDKTELYGFTAAHCTPRARPGSTIVSPSTLELTGRLGCAARYTSFAPNPLRTIHAREEEVISLLKDWQNEESEDGYEIREPLISGGIRERRLKLNGRRFGMVVATSASYISGVLEEHNSRLHQQNLKFNLPDDSDITGAGNGTTSSRIEWCCFEVSKDRYV
jgi:hypothetical protein